MRTILFSENLKFQTTLCYIKATLQEYINTLIILTFFFFYKAFYRTDSATDAGPQKEIFVYLFLRHTTFSFLHQTISFDKK